MPSHSGARTSRYPADALCLRGRIRPVELSILRLTIQGIKRCSRVRRRRRSLREVDRRTIHRRQSLSTTFRLSLRPQVQLAFATFPNGQPHQPALAGGIGVYCADTNCHAPADRRATYQTRTERGVPPAKSNDLRVVTIATSPCV